MGTKLACEHSDLDLAVRGLSIHNRDELNLYMLRVNEKLSGNLLVVNSTPIPTARAPIISAVQLQTIYRSST
jgi:hypothetical protein